MEIISKILNTENTHIRLPEESLGWILGILLALWILGKSIDWLQSKNIASLVSKGKDANDIKNEDKYHTHYKRVDSLGSQASEGTKNSAIFAVNLPYEVHKLKLDRRTENLLLYSTNRYKLAADSGENLPITPRGIRFWTKLTLFFALYILLLMLFIIGTAYLFNQRKYLETSLWVIFLGYTFIHILFRYLFYICRDDRYCDAYIILKCSTDPGYTPSESINNSFNRACRIIGTQKYDWMKKYSTTPEFSGNKFITSTKSILFYFFLKSPFYAVCLSCIDNEINRDAGKIIIPENIN